MNTFTNALLHYLSPAQLAAIRLQKVGIGGSGGIGSNVAIILARSGFSHFKIIDKDTVEASNLNRQAYALADIGRPKVDALRTQILSINPDADVITYHQTWEESTSAGMFTGCGVIVEAFDKAEWKARFVDFYHHRTPYMVSGNGMAGLCTGAGLPVRKIGNIYFVGDGTTGIEDGHPPLAPRVLECAARMAGIILMHTLDQGVAAGGSGKSCPQI